MSSSDAPPVKILWTGGWDSTFQLLRLLLVDVQAVQPIYMIDENRRSLRHELLAMRRIKHALLKRYPHTRQLLAPPMYHSLRDIVVPPAITQAFLELREKHRIGGQYEWLTAFCINQGLSDLQLCIHRDDRAYPPAKTIIESAADPDHLHQTPEWVVFGPFQYPMLELTKPDMARIAHERGWDDLMDMTWFCHRPIDDLPCGQCNPCLFTIEEGLARRIPAHRRIHTGFTALDRSIHKLARFSYRLTRRSRKPARPIKKPHAIEE